MTDQHSSTVTTSLLPCPFCGSADIDPAGWMSSDKRTGPACDDCGGSTESVERWNTRPGHDAPVKALERMQPLLDGDRPTVNEQNIWEHWRAQNALLIELRKIVDAALSQVRP